VSTAILWFRRDLRLTDHPALETALRDHDTIVPVYVHAPEEESPWPAGGASDWWLHHSLTALAAALNERGAPLVVRRGTSADVLESLARETGATDVYAVRMIEPAAQARDQATAVALGRVGVALHLCAANLFFAPGTVLNGSGAPFRVFTPFWRACRARFDDVEAPTPAPRRLPGPQRPPSGVSVDALELLPKVAWAGGLASHWTPGEAAALSQLDAFLAGPVRDYATLRDRPDLAATSRLSAALHFGEVSPRQILAAVRTELGPRSLDAEPGFETFVREVGWREFAHHVLAAFPHTTDEPLDERFRGMAWGEEPARIRAWQRGRTGVPLVDAGMRELWHTGWMHNRVRMVVASFLTKNLGQHWRVGARWFHDTLVDADLSSNSFGWQWAAGCGADAAPYYRIFNPILQAERFDPERRYLRRWLPELAALPDEWIHRPHEAPGAVLATAKVALDRDYPRPIVDLAASRDRALANYQAMKGAPPAAAASRPTKRKAPRGGQGSLL
jgi:deoxyribodipyrimidine photo-lyase